MEPSTPPTACRMCESPVGAGARFCSTCGFELVRAPSAPARPPAARWYHNPWLILLLLFFVLGPLALPLVWKTPRFSRGVKLTLTVAMVLYLGWFAALVARLLHVVGTDAQQLNSVLQGF